MRVLVACEFSGSVRDAFAGRGHDAWSCDLLPSETQGNHIRGDVLGVLADRWDLMIAFPPCTRLCASGARWFASKQKEQAEAADFFLRLAKCDIPRIAIENPVGVMSRLWRRPDQIIQPWQFGHAEIKTTCLWLKNLPALRSTNIIRTERAQKCWKMPPSERRGLERARTYRGIAEAMAGQWSDPIIAQMNLEVA